jgi:transposase
LHNATLHDNGPPHLIFGEGIDTWIGKYHRVERQAQQVNDEHLYEELKRLRKENIRLKEERDILKKAAAYFAQQLP